ncbi:MAG: RHS repeat-associated core domain-containing protein, partial [Chloroflexota bacterium]
MSYDDQGNLLSRTDQLGQTTSYTYNGLGRITSIIDPQGAAAAFTYDANGNLLTATDALGNSTAYAYDGKGQIITITDALGRITTFTYDSQGNVSSSTDQLGGVTTMTYDAAGNLIAVADALGSTTAFTYDELGRQLTMTDPKGNVTSSVYDALGNRVAATDGNGNITRYEYDHRQQVTRMIDALNQITEITYLAGSKLPASLTDAKGQTTTFTYDSMGRLTGETDPLGKTITYQYDAKGNLTSRTDGAGNTITYTYDALGRLLSKSFPDGTSDLFSYDAKGRVLTASNQHIAYSMTYDPLGRLLSISDSNGRTIGYEYDKLGNRTRMIMPDNETVDYRYDQANRLAAINSFPGAFSFAYDALGRRTGLNAANGVTTAYSYDPAGLLTEIITRDARRNNVLSSYSYSHDAVGNRLSKSMSMDTDKGYGRGHNYHAQAERFDYTYDPVYRLIDTLALREGKQTEKEMPNRSESFTYDPVGNRISGPKWDDTYTHNEANQLLSSRKHEYLYDANGNLSAKLETDCDAQDTWTYEYDFENRLVKATRTDEDEIRTVSFKYDPFGRRIEKRIEEIETAPLVNFIKTRIYSYVYDNEDIILEIRSDEDDADSTSGGRGKHREHWRKRISKPAVSRFVHGPGIDEPLANEQQGKVYFYHADGLGSITSLTDAKGRVVQSCEYDSFGSVRQHGNHVKQPYGFTAREWDKETGLYFYRARYYDPQVGRFISKDPIGFNGGDVVLYGYVQNNPVNFVDPEGLQKIYGNWCGPDWTGGYDKPWDQLTDEEKR